MDDLIMGGQCSILKPKHVTGPNTDLVESPKARTARNGEANPNIAHFLPTQLSSTLNVGLVLSLQSFPCFSDSSISLSPWTCLVVC